MLKRFVYLIMIFATIPLVSIAETVEMRDSLKHEVRIGWGDQQFETLAWHPNVLPEFSPDYGYFEKKINYRYTQHWFVEYQYRINSWLGVGGMFDGSAVLWDIALIDQDVTRGVVLNQYFYNLVVMPTVRFTYFHKKYVSLYSGLGLGLNINGGTEMDLHGNFTACSMAVNLTALAVEVGLDHWFGAVEFGGMFAMKSKNVVYMADSRIFTASVGYRF